MDAPQSPPRAPIDVDGFVRAVNLLLVGTGVIVLDLRVGTFDALLDPVGQAIVLAGLVLLVRSTPRTPLAPPTIGLGVAALGLSLALELAVLGGRAAVGTVNLSTGGSGLGMALFAAQALGIVVMAQHLRRVLDGVASDRWRQVTIAWVVSLVLTPLLMLTKDLMLLLLDGAVVIIAAVLLLLSLLATRAHVRDESGGGPPSGTLDL